MTLNPACGNIYAKFNQGVEMCTLSEAAQLMGVKRQALWVAIKKGKLKARKNENGDYRIEYADLDLYRTKKYKRSLNPALFSDIVEKGLITISDASKKYDLKKNLLYYLMSSKKIKFHRNGHWCAVEESDIIKLKEKILQHADGSDKANAVT